MFNEKDMKEIFSPKTNISRFQIKLSGVSYANN